MEDRYIATVDLGTSKIALAIAKVNGRDIQVIFYRETPSDGIRNSIVYNPKKASEPIRRLISEAEDELKIKILQVVVGLPRYGVRQETKTAELTRTSPMDWITDEEIADLKSLALDTYPLENPEKDEIYGAVAQSFSTEDLMGTEEDVIGAAADKIDGTFKMFVGAKRTVASIEKVIGEIGIAVGRKYFLPDVVAKAVLTREEMENGVALLEFGAGVSSVTIYQNNTLRFYEAIPFGGKNITTDIKYEGGFQERLAENIKLAYGACLPEKLQSMSDKILQINDNESGTTRTIQIKYLSEIIDARAREIAEALLFLIARSGWAERLRNGIVITGGGANLLNMAALIKEMSSLDVRTGFPRPRRFTAEGCPEVTETGAVASVGMILRAAADEHLNCTQEISDETQEDVDSRVISNAPSAQSEETLTLSGDNEVIAPKPPKPVKPKNKNRIGPLGWLKTIGQITDEIEGKAANTIGNLFDQSE